MKVQERQLAEGILFTDQYQLTMAQLYYRLGLHDRLVQFDHFFRKYPDYGSHKAGYCIHAGLEWLLDWMREARFGEGEIAFLKKQEGQSGTHLFKKDFLDWLQEEGNFKKISMRSIPEGRVVHANVPLTIVQGPLAMAQILESSLLNHINYQTLIATKASRIFMAGCHRMTIEFGLRRGQDRGAIAGARAALIGGAQFSSNTGISCALGYQPKGTHAHSMVQFFMALGEGEIGAFRAYADIYPDDCLLLVDTVDTLESGVPNAIKVFEELRRKGHKPLGIRLDSGDLAYLSIKAALMLNKAGFPDSFIVLSNKIDELILLQIITQIREESPHYGLDADQLVDRLIYGVGTKLITSYGHAALDGVYKLVAVHQRGEWLPAIKVSESAKKTINPGNKNVWRLYDREDRAVVDLIALECEDPRTMNQFILHHPTESSLHRTLQKNDISRMESLFVDILREGMEVYNSPSIDTIRLIRDEDLRKLYQGVKRIVNPHIYHVSLSDDLWRLKQKLIHNRLHSSR